MIRFGILSSLWTPTWMREGALAAVRGSAVHGLQVVEIALLEPDEVDAQHSLSLFDQYGVAPTATTAPVIPKPPRIDDAPGKTLAPHGRKATRRTQSPRAPPTTGPLRTARGCPAQCRRTYW